MTNKTKPIKILADNCIISLGETMQGTYRQKKFVEGDKTVPVEVLGWERKPKPSEDQAWKQKQIEYLPTIGRIAKEKQILLYTYLELRHEALRRNATNKFGNVFKDVEITSVDAAVERSYFFPGELSSYISKKESKLIEFCKWLLKLTPDDINNIVERPPELRTYPKFLLDNLKNVRRFRELCKGLVENHYPDAFHLWSAEVNGVNFFLTIDRKFINVMTKTKKIDLPCKPISPEDLLDELDISELEPFEFQEGVFYNYCGNPIKNHKKQETVGTYKKILDNFKNLLFRNKKDETLE
ncbi:MAG: hypothetical protein FE834_03895 [Gammaproteobacteria bacterium]|nr:hypothetical protein [Gammaproteobacteria bacterium]